MPSYAAFAADDRDHVPTKPDTALVKPIQDDLAADPSPSQNWSCGHLRSRPENEAREDLKTTDDRGHSTLCPSCCTALGESTKHLSELQINSRSDEALCMPQQRDRFVSLPSELRLLILDHLLWSTFWPAGVALDCTEDLPSRSKMLRVTVSDIAKAYPEIELQDEVFVSIRKIVTQFMRIVEIARDDQRVVCRRLHSLTSDDGYLLQGGESDAIEQARRDFERPSELLNQLTNWYYYLLELANYVFLRRDVTAQDREDWSEFLALQPDVSHSMLTCEEALDSYDDSESDYDPEQSDESESEDSADDYDGLESDEVWQLFEAQDLTF